MTARRRRAHDAKTADVGEKERTSFQSARAFVQGLRLDGRQAWVAYCKSGRKPDNIPASPDHAYKHEGWVSWGDWLGSRKVANQDRRFRPFHEARTFAHELSLTGKTAWAEYCKSGRKPEDVPASPARTYKGEWVSWGDWLGTKTIATYNRHYRPFQKAREFARSLNLPRTEAWFLYCKSDQKPDDIPTAPSRVYRNTGWIGMWDWLGTGNVRSFRPFKEARDFVHTRRIQGKEGWGTYCKSGNKPEDIPTDPVSVYKDSGWTTWGDWLGTGNVAPRDMTFRPFNEAREFVRDLKFTGQQGWKVYCNSGQRPDDVPVSPDQTYKNKGWVNWGDWFGTGTVATHKRSYRSFESAREFARHLQLTRKEAWFDYCGSGEKPHDIPGAPDRAYKGKGWVTWADWLGSGYVAPRYRKFRSFDEARKFVHGLNLSGQQGWLDYCKSGGKPKDIPTDAVTVYKGKGWVNLGDWLGTGNIAPKDMTFRRFREARKFVHALHLKDQGEWKSYCKSGRKPDDIPNDPYTVYKKEGWRGVGDWLGTGAVASQNKVFRPFTEARQFVHALALDGKDAWGSYCKSGRKPDDIPATPPHVYRDDGWTGWGDWLGLTEVQTLDGIRGFVRSLAPHLSSYTPAELWVVFQQSGALNASGGGKAFIKALATGRFPQEEVNKFVNGEPSSVDEFFTEAEPIAVADSGPLDEAEEEVVDNVVTDIDDDAEVMDDALPTLTVSASLNALTAAVAHASDAEAIEFLVASCKDRKLWHHAFRDEEVAVTEARAFVGTGYADTVRTSFLKEYETVKSLEIPKGYAFVKHGDTKVTDPNLMQRLIASRIQRERRMGNWSGTGAGKTNSALLATRVVGARLTVVCCPNSVVHGWHDAILDMFPDSKVVCKTLVPDWGKATKHRYLVLNYEMFQQPDSAEKVRTMVDKQGIDFVVIDEVQFVKQRNEDLSRRRENVGAMLMQATEKYPGLHVLGMSATPVINNLREPVALIEMITSVKHDELKTTSTVANCMRVYQRLTTLGPRWLMDHKTGCLVSEVPVELSNEVVEKEIRLHRRQGGTPLQLEEILTQARLPTILKSVVRKTLVYTHYVGGTERLDTQLRVAMEEAGWRTGFYTGDDKSGLAGFLDPNGDVDVLVASSAIATGVDGLQHVCNRLIINVLPWTAAEFEQLIGRIHRQGQERNVEVIIPITYAVVGDEEWSWCKAKMQRLHFKKSIADAAVDGVVPMGHLRSPETAYQDLMAWLERLSVGRVVDLDRAPVTFTPQASGTREKPLARFGDFSRMNAQWNRASSSSTHERLEREPAEWLHYHEELARIRTDWPADPQEEFIRWAKRRTNLVVGDFGCGRDKVRAELADRHEVHSFDHVATSAHVVACDMAHVPLEDETLSVVLFCLSLMGSNPTDYIREAHRTLSLDGWLHIYHPTQSFSDRDKFVKGLRDLGFSNVEVGDIGDKFTHVSARKSEHRPRADAVLVGLGG